MRRICFLAALVLSHAASAAITRDSGASTFPVTGTRVDSTTGPLTTGTFSTTQAVTLIVGVGYRNNTASIFPMSLAWSGGTPAGASTWTKVSEQHTPSGELDVAFWSATAASALSGVAVTITPTAIDSGTNSLAYMIDALAGASIAISNTANVISSGTTVNKFVTLAGVAAGSWLYFASTADVSTAYSTQTNTVKAVETTAGLGGHQSAAGYNSAGASGSVPLGWTGTQAWFVGVGIEVPAAPPPATMTLGSTRIRMSNSGASR